MKAGSDIRYMQMDYFFSPTVKQCTEEVIIPKQYDKQLFSAHGNLIAAIHNALAPYNFSINLVSGGAQISGDDIAVKLATNIVRTIADDKVDSPPPDASNPESVISSVISDALKRELVFRMNGVSYPIAPMSMSQVAYMQLLLTTEKQLILGVGSTGTGKTHLAIAAALNYLAEGRVKRIVITKPHVLMEGEVMTPALRQEMDDDSQFEFFDDIFRDLIGYQRYEKLKAERKLELTPLGHIRGRTFNDAFIILDEAQNMSVRKMRMAVTRMGRSSKMVITGDPVHIDLSDGETSGLTHLLGLLEGTELAKIYRFQNNQVIRNPLVAELEKLYSDQTENVSFQINEA